MSGRAQLTPTEEQAAALEAIEQWYSMHLYDQIERSGQTFLLDGGAGTGKTTVAQMAFQRLSVKRPVFGAYTAKAARVMAAKGMEGASTLHRLLYTPKLDASGNVIGWGRLDTQSPCARADLIVVDEISMLPQEQLEDLLSFDRPILVLGDVGGQLPPIDGKSAFAGRQPNFRLHDVHRTAAQSPITALAWSVRRNGDLPPASPMVRRMKDNAWPTILNRDWQVLCGKHSSRLAVTRRARAHYGFSGSTPSPGEPLICRRNSYRYGVMNGDLCVVWRIEENDLSQPYFVATLLLDGEELENIRCARRLFEAHNNPKGEPAPEEYDIRRRRDSVNFLQLDWAYAITVYSAQGSEFPNVILIDDRFGAWDRDLRRRFLYTGITRSSENLIVYTTG